MENELLDFTAQKNFDFFQYRYTMTENRKAQFLTDCQKVLEGAHATVVETLKLAVHVSKLKNSGVWKDVVNPEDGMSFLYSSFETFCKYAFGFKKNRTSNLLGIAEFVKLDKKGVLTYNRPQYEKMNMSKLIELIPLPEFEREYFTPEMTVADMRLCKAYIREDYVDFSKNRYSEGFNLLERAKQWTEAQQQKEEQRTAESVTEELKKAAETTVYTSGETEYHQFSLPIEETEEEEVYLPISGYENEGYSFSTRAQVRKFLAGYTDWQALCGNEFFEEIYRYRFKNGMELYAATCKMCVNVTVGEDKGLLFFFLGLGGGAQPIKISKYKLEIWLRANESELFGGR